jgi:hypothetical protein
MLPWQDTRASTGSVMSMTQLVIGAALGFMVAQGALLGIRHLVGWVQQGNVRERIRALTPAHGQAIIDGFIKYAAPLGASAALITLGVWAVSDYLNAKSLHTDETASALDLQAAVPESPVPDSTQQGAKPAPVPAATPVAMAATDAPGPYADPNFRVRRRSHRAGSASSLKETILQRSEAKARDELLLETHQHANRSQYDCEAADRAEKYVKAGLDVWGFAAWQVKHFPPGVYKGATLQQCKDLKAVVEDSSRLDLQSTVAQRNH